MLTSCKCGVLYNTKHSIVDYKCDACYLKTKKKNDTHSEEYQGVKHKRLNRLTESSSMGQHVNDIEE